MSAVGISVLEGGEEVNLGDQVQGESIDPDLDVDQYHFDGEVGQQVEIYTLADDRDHALGMRLLDSSGTLIGSNNSILRESRRIVLPRNDTYIISVRSLRERRVDAYMVRLELVSP